MQLWHFGRSSERRPLLRICNVGCLCTAHANLGCCSSSQAGFTPIMNLKCCVMPDRREEEGQTSRRWMSYLCPSKERRSTAALSSSGGAVTARVVYGTQVQPGHWRWANRAARAACKPSSYAAQCIIITAACSLSAQRSGVDQKCLDGSSCTSLNPELPCTLAQCMQGTTLLLLKELPPSNPYLIFSWHTMSSACLSCL